MENATIEGIYSWNSGRIESQFLSSPIIKHYRLSFSPKTLWRKQNIVIQSNWTVLSSYNINIYVWSHWMQRSGFHLLNPKVFCLWNNGLSTSKMLLSPKFCRWQFNHHMSCSSFNNNNISLEKQERMHERPMYFVSHITFQRTDQNFWKYVKILKAYIGYSMRKCLC